MKLLYCNLTCILDSQEQAACTAACVTKVL